MRKTRGKKIVALLLAMALTATAVPDPGDSADVKAATGDAATGSAVTTTPATGSAVTTAPVTGTAATMETVKEIIRQNQLAGAPDGSFKKFLVQGMSMTDPAGQFVVFVQKKLAKKNMKYVTTDVNNDGYPELFVLNPNKRLDMYLYESPRMVDDGQKKFKSFSKKVSEIRCVSTKKGTFAIKQKKGKTTHYLINRYYFDSKKVKDVCKTTADYAKKGKKYTKNGKKISKKKFNKFLKKYKRYEYYYLDSVPTIEYPLYDYTYNRLLRDGELYVRSLQKTPDDQIVDRLVLRKDEKEPYPFKAFGEIEYINGDGTDNYRVVLGPNVKDEKTGKTYLEEDWTKLAETEMDVTSVSPLLKGILSGDKTYNYGMYERMTDEKLNSYSIGIFDEDGCEADYYYRILVDDTGRLARIETVTSTNVIDDKLEFYYDQDASVDGERYTPGIDGEIYAFNESYQKDDSLVRTMKVDCAGTEETIRAASFVLFRFFSKAGTFEAFADGKKSEIPMLDQITGKTDINNLINPEDEDGFFQNVTAKVTWTKAV